MTAANVRGSLDFDWNSPEFRMSRVADLHHRHVLERAKLLSAWSTVAIGESSGAIVRVSGSIEPVPGVYRDFLLLVPRSYPYGGPSARSVGWRCTGPHCYGKDEMCLWQAHQWSPRYTLAYAVAKTFVWIHKHELYLADGRWPGREQPHGGA